MIMYCTYTTKNVSLISQILLQLCLCKHSHEWQINCIFTPLIGATIFILNHRRTHMPWTNNTLEHPSHIKFCVWTLGAPAYILTTMSHIFLIFFHLKIKIASLTVTEQPQSEIMKWQASPSANNIWSASVNTSLLYVLLVNQVSAFCSESYGMTLVLCCCWLFCHDNSRLFQAKLPYPENYLQTIHLWRAVRNIIMNRQYAL